MQFVERQHIQSCLRERKRSLWMQSPTNDPKLSLLELPSMDDDSDSLTNSPISARFTPMLTPSTDPVSPHVQGAHAKAIHQPPKIRITLLSRALVTFVVGTCIFLAVFSAVAVNGVVVYTKAVQPSTESIDDEVEVLNAISGFLIALVEVMLGVYMNNFLPAFQVYLHNMLWFLHGSAKATRVSKGLRAFLMFTFPVFLMLVIGQCLRSFQASQSTVGFETRMLFKDLVLDESVVELVKLQVDENEESGPAASSTTNTTVTTPDRISLKVLRSAVKGSASPLDVMAPSNCSSTRGNLRVGLTDLDSANVAFGFPAKEWYTEMLDVALNKSKDEIYTFAQAVEAFDKKKPLDPPDFDLVLASDMYATAKILLDRTVAESTMYYSECTGSDDRTLVALLSDAEDATSVDEKAEIKCAAANRTLIDIGTFQDKPKLQTIEHLMDFVAAGLELGVDRLRHKTTVMRFNRFNVTDQVDVESMTIDADIYVRKTNSPFYADNETDFYSYGEYARDLCGTDNCVFIDTNNKLELPRQVVMVPYRKNCKYTADSIKYVRDVRSFIPADCEVQNNSALVISIASFINADYYGSDLSKYDPTQPATPGLANPVRRLRIAISKINWKTQDLTELFQQDRVVCVRKEGKCEGLSYRLTKTGRYVFVGEESIPTKAIMNASLAVPIRLVQLNPARLYLEGLTKSDEDKTPIDEQLTPERLSWGQGDSNYKKWSWKKKLEKEECSSYMDAYMKHINENWLYIERPTDVLYRSAMFYLFSEASVTELNNTELAIQVAQGNTTLNETLGLLTNLKLKGDTDFRSIRVKVPSDTYWATIAGCCVLLIISLLVVAFPHRPMEYFAATVTTADKFIKLKNGETYPDIVHTKTLLFPATGETQLMEQFHVDELTLVNQTNPNEELQF